MSSILKRVGMWVGYRFWPILSIVFLVCFLLLSQLFLGTREIFLSPLGEGVLHKLVGRKPQVVGFLPYWNLQDDYEINFSVIDQLIYFGLIVAEDGSFLEVQAGEAEPGLNKLNSDSVEAIFQEARKKHKKILVSFISFDARITDTVISDAVVRERLISGIVNLVREKGLDGADIDFEYFPDDDNLEDFGKQFNQFLRLLKKELVKNDRQAILSVDIYPKAFIYDWPYRLKEMGQIVDQVIIMAYDYTQSNSAFAGPVAPMKNKDEREMSIVQTMIPALDRIDKTKLILGIPLYGYEWRTVSEEPRSRTYWGSGQMASYARVKELISEEKLIPKWDEIAFSPWLVYKKGWQIKQIYYDDLRSIALKVELSQQLGLKGMAFWALGYEGNDGEVWQFLKKKL